MRRLRATSMATIAIVLFLLLGWGCAGSTVTQPATTVPPVVTPESRTKAAAPDQLPPTAAVTARAFTPPPVPAKPALPATPKPGPTRFEVTELDVQPAEAEAGQPITVKALVSNRGESMGTFAASLTIDGQPIESKDIRIGPGDTETVTFTVTRDSPGKFEVALGPLKKSVNITGDRQYLLRRDSGQSGQNWAIYEPRGLWVNFTPPVRPFQIQNIVVRGRRTDFPEAEKKTYTIKVWDKSFTRQLYTADYPYSKFSTTAALVRHEIDPPVAVNDDFYVDFISHSVAPPQGEQPKIAIYVAADYTVESGDFSGISYLGTIDARQQARHIEMEPRRKNSAWIVQVQGTGRATAATLTPAPRVKVPATPVSTSPTSPARPTPTPRPAFLNYENSTYKFRINYPRDWAKSERVEVQAKSAVVAFFSPKQNPSDDFANYVLVSVDDMPSHIKDLDGLVKLQIDGLRALTVDFNHTGTGVAMVAGGEARRILWNAKHGPRSVKGSQVFVIRNQKYYVLTYWAEENSFATFEGLAQQMFDSFEFF